MSDTSIWVILPITIIAGREAAWESFFAAMRDRVHAEEPGTLKFDMYRVQGVERRYCMVEHYADQAAWDFHSMKQGERGVVPEMISYTDGPPEFMFLDPVVT